MGPPQWSGDSNFDLRYHLRRVKVCEPTLDAVLDLARTAAMAGFDRARPLWEYTLVEGLEGGRSAMILKVHHSMTDGVGGMKLLLMLFDFARDPEPMPALDRVDAVPTFGPMDLVLSALGHNQRRALGIARRSVTESIGLTRAVINDPAQTVRDALRAAGSIVRFLEPATVPFSPIMQARTLARQLSTLDVPLDDLKRAAKTVGGSLNDSFIAAVLGGMQRYHEFHGVDVRRAAHGHADQPARRRRRARRQPLHTGPVPRPADDQGSRRTGSSRSAG